MGFDMGVVPLNSDGWGLVDALVVPLSLGGSVYIPFAPFSRSDKLGRIADDSLAAGAEDSSFCLVDAKPPPKPPRFGPKWRFNQRPHLPQHQDEEVEARRREAEKERARRDRQF